MTAPESAISQIARIVAKVGTSTLTDESGRISVPYIRDLARQLAEQRAAGRDVVLVTSGAIQAGRERLEGEKGRRGEGEQEPSPRPSATPLPTSGEGTRAGTDSVSTKGNLLQAGPPSPEVGRGDGGEGFRDGPPNPPITGGTIGSSGAQREAVIASEAKQSPADSASTIGDCFVVPPRNDSSPSTCSPRYWGQPEARGRGASTLPYKQAAAAVGQGLLMNAYTEAFATHGIPVGQVLLTRSDLADRRRFLNARNTLTALLALGVVPIINENDTVAVEEIRFGDNDTLAARVAVLVEANLLLILSDVDGLFARDASGALTSMVIPEVAAIDAAVESLAGGPGSPAGTGGMKTKIEAARIATGSGIRTIVARGGRLNVVADVVSGGGIGTTFLPAARLRGRKRWIASGSRSRGSVTVNEGAALKLRSHAASLLAVGIVNVCGEFDAGDVIEVVDPAGRRVGRGVANYAAADVRILQGLRSDQFESALGYKTQDEVIHRDNLVLDR